MKTDLFVLCDAATLQSGKMNILGTFDRLRAPNVPFRHGSFTVAVILRFSDPEDGEHHIKIDLINEDGKLVHKVFERKTKLGVPEDTIQGTHQILCTVNNLKFEKFGQHELVLTVDGNPVAELILYVTQVNRPPA